VPARRFLVSCRRCNQTVAIVQAMGDADLARLQVQLRSHLLVCRPHEALSEPPRLGELLQYFKVVLAAPDFAPPDAA
jgi:hypothetical protein